MASKTDCKPLVEIFPTERTDTFWNNEIAANDPAVDAKASADRTVDNSVEVTLPAPPPPADIRFDKALSTDCNPFVDILPTERTDAAFT